MFPPERRLQENGRVPISLRNSVLNRPELSFNITSEASFSHLSMLKLYQKGTYVTYPYLESPYNRVLSHIRYTPYLITMRKHTELLRTILLIA